MPLNTFDIACADDDQDDSILLKKIGIIFIEDLNHTKVW